MSEVEQQSLDVLLSQRERLSREIGQAEEEIGVLEDVTNSLRIQRERHEYLLGQIDSVLGKSPQIQLEDSCLPLRGQRIGEVAVEVLAGECGEGAELHYTDWFALLKQKGHSVAGKDPVNTFLTQINRSPRVESIGRRTGRYRLIRDRARDHDKAASPRRHVKLPLVRTDTPHRGL